MVKFSQATVKTDIFFCIVHFFSNLLVFGHTCIAGGENKARMLKNCVFQHKRCIFGRKQGKLKKMNNTKKIVFTIPWPSFTLITPLHKSVVLKT